MSKYANNPNITVGSGNRVHVANRADLKHNTYAICGAGQVTTGTKRRGAVRIADERVFGTEVTCKRCLAILEAEENVRLAAEIVSEEPLAERIADMDRDDFETVVDDLVAENGVDAMREVIANFKATATVLFSAGHGREAHALRRKNVLIARAISTFERNQAADLLDQAADELLAAASEPVAPVVEDKPIITTGSANITIPTGSSDVGAWHRAVELGLALYNAGMWDGRALLSLYGPRSLHNRVFGVERLPITSLVYDRDYRIAGIDFDPRVIDAEIEDEIIVSALAHYTADPKRYEREGGSYASKAYEYALFNDNSRRLSSYMLLRSDTERQRVINKIHSAMVMHSAPRKTYVITVESNYRGRSSAWRIVMRDDADEVVNWRIVTSEEGLNSTVDNYVGIANAVGRRIRIDRD